MKWTTKLWRFITTAASTAVDQPNISIAAVASNPPMPRQWFDQCYGACA